MTQQIEAESVEVDSRWWRDAVIYQIYLRSFADGDGDGVGDLLGVRSRLRYLSWLGVDALWLTPFYRSPMADGGYDVSDYRAVDPGFGTLGDAESLIQDAHRYGLKVIVDIVPNHTSAAHPWFDRAVEAGPGSPERDRYIFRPGRGDRPPNDWESIFGGPAWTRLPDGEWYLHLFAPEQPDLNWDNPEVHAEFEDIMRFWLDRGVDGFRVDVAHGMVKAAGLPDAGHTGQISMLGHAELPYFDQDGVHDIHRSWRRLLDSYGGIGVAEAWAPNAERLSHYVRPDELHQAFNFHYLKAAWSAADLRRVIDDSLAATGRVGAPTTWVLSNHDVQRHVTRYGGGWIGARRARAAALLTLALPGSTYVYQGEELGLPEVTDLPQEYRRDPQWGSGLGREGCRIPIPWAYAEPPFGFSPPMVGESWLPVPPEWRSLTVEAQLDDPRSMLRLYREALRVRKEHPALGDGELRWLDAPPHVLLFARDPGFVCAVNLSDEPVWLDVRGTVLLSSGRVRDGELGPDAAVWWACP
jgi:alpha-glucosidase